MENFAKSTHVTPSHAIRKLKSISYEAHTLNTYTL